MSKSQQYNITSNDIRPLLTFFSNRYYTPHDTNKTTEGIENQCLYLIRKDYPNFTILANEKGELSDSYPSKIIIPNNYEQTDDSDENEDEQLEMDKLSNGSPNRLDVVRLKELMAKARIARCRARFPIPVILYKNKYICRSSTLSCGAEIYGRSVINKLNYSSKVANYAKLTEHYSDEEDEIDGDYKCYSISDTSQVFTKVRSQDIKLLKELNIRHICDLMLENKKVKFWMNVTSSEKIDKENRYSEFDIISLPYPGCEFFREYRNNNYSGEGLVYNWNQDFVDAKLDLPDSNHIKNLLQVDINDYKQWDIIKLTLAYVKLMLHFIKESDSSFLIHCISGWDRTPLFISLVRLSLWADGEIHKSLNAAEITYLTVAYDWFLFGHDLNDRLTKGEEIMFFCFQFLKFIVDDDFKIDYKPQAEEGISMKNRFDSKAKRKISLDFYSNNEDFVIDNLSGSLNSLTSNSSFVTAEQLNFAPTSKGHKNTAFTLVTSSPPELVHFNSDNSSVENIQLEKMSLYDDDMESTLTSSDVLFEGSSKIVPTASGKNVSSPSREATTTKPVAIPNVKSCSFGYSNKSINSLSRSDSWQLVSDAGSIRDRYSANHYSSPDSLGSLKKTNNDSVANSNSPLSVGGKAGDKPGNEKQKPSSRKERLLEVRSIFNSAYTSLSIDFANAGRWIFRPLSRDLRRSDRSD